MDKNSYAYLTKRAIEIMQKSNNKKAIIKELKKHIRYGNQSILTKKADGLLKNEMESLKKKYAKFIAWDLKWKDYSFEETYKTMKHVIKYSIDNKLTAASLEYSIYAMIGEYVMKELRRIY